MVSALFMFLSVLVSVFNGMDEGFTPLLISAAVTLLAGYFPVIFVKKPDIPSVREGYLIIVLAWLCSFIFGMLPYLMYGQDFTLINSFFESVSGYTTTGSTIVTAVESLPKSILFWRSSTHFIGGLGVIVLLLMIMPDTSTAKFRLSSLELSVMSKGGYRFKAGKVVRIMVGVYLMLALTETLLLMLAGMTPFDAINHSFSTVATGGFSTKNTSIMHFDSNLIDIIIIVYMTLAATHFGVIYAIFAKRSFAPLLKDVPKYYLSVILVLSLCVTLTLMFQGGYTSFGKALLDSVFQVVSFLTTTGFGNADNALWPVLANFFLLFAAFHCGCSGSTTGGVKADRMLVAFKSIRNEIKLRIHPNAVSRVHLDGGLVRNDVIYGVALYIVLYITFLFLSFILVLLTGVEVHEAFSGTLSSIGNVGPALGSLGTMGNYAAQPDAAKLIYAFDMFLGRVEIFPIISVIGMALSRKR